MLRVETIQYNLPQDRIPRAWHDIQAGSAEAVCA
jgi:hypothetical protein